MTEAGRGETVNRDAQSAINLQGSAATQTAAASQDDWLCPGCGYSLRGINSEKCPECGIAIDRSAMGVVQTPWVHRKSIGAWRAYWRTVWMATLTPRRIAQDINKPLLLADAQWFRRITTAMVYVPIVVVTVALTCRVAGSSNRRALLLLDQPAALIAQGGLILVSLASGWLAIFAVTGVASYFFHPMWLPVARQNRAIALSYYACGPLAWLVLTSMAALVLGLLRSADYANASTTLIVLSVVMFGSFFWALVASWRATLVLLRRTTDSSGSRTALLACLLPIQWVVLLALIGVGLPIVYIWLVLCIGGSFQ